VLSQLHAHIQDAFNEAEVQIMSPHFESQPDRTVYVPKAKWRSTPAEGDGRNHPLDKESGQSDPVLPERSQAKV
jgi:hypothetical protein